MATRIEGTIRRSEVVPAPVETVWSIVDDIPGLADLIPKVASIVPRGDDWRWQLDAIEALGFRLEPGFTVRFEREPPTALRFDEAGEGRNAANGAVTLDAVDGGTRIAFAISVRLALDIPKLLSRPATALLDREMAAMADGFFTNIRAAVQG